MVTMSTNLALRPLPQVRIRKAEHADLSALLELEQRVFATDRLSRRSLLRYPGTIVVEILDPVPPGLPRAEARAVIQDRIETACARLIAEARAAPNPPPLPAAATVGA